jgi:hypothetical protein
MPVSRSTMAIGIGDGSSCNPVEMCMGVACVRQDRPRA